jgi:hypothetical protein
MMAWFLSGVELIFVQLQNEQESKNIQSTSSMVGGNRQHQNGQHERRG